MIPTHSNIVILSEGDSFQEQDLKEKRSSSAKLGSLNIAVIGTVMLGVIQSLLSTVETPIFLVSPDLLSLLLGLGWFFWVVLISSKRPEYTVGCLFFFTFFTAWRPIDLNVGSLQPSQLLAIAAVVGCLLPRLTMRRPGGQGFLNAPLPILILVMVTGVSIVMTMGLNISSTTGMAIMRSGRADPIIRSITGIAALLIGICGYYATRMSLLNRDMIIFALHSWIAGGIFSSLVGAYLLLRYYVPFLPGLPISAMVGIGGRGVITRDAAALGLGSGIGTEMVARMASFAMEPRHLVCLLAPLLAYLFVCLMLKSWSTRREMIWLMIATIVILCGFTLTTSRSTYVVGMAVACIVLWTTRFRFMSSLSMAFGLMLFFSFSIAISGTIILMMSGYNPLEFIAMQLDSLSRIHVTGSGMVYSMDGLSVAWEMFKESPILGKGWGSYVYYTTAFFDLFFAQQSNPNNLYLMMMGETGVLGLIALLWVFLYGLRLSPRRLPGRALGAYGPILRGTHAALLATYACFMIWDTIHYTHFWMLLGLAETTRMSSIKDSQ